MMIRNFNDNCPVDNVLCYSLSFFSLLIVVSVTRFCAKIKKSMKNKFFGATSITTWFCYYNSSTYASTAVLRNLFITCLECVFIGGYEMNFWNRVAIFHFRLYNDYFIINDLLLTLYHFFALLFTTHPIHLFILWII